MKFKILVNQFTAQKSLYCFAMMTLLIGTSTDSGEMSSFELLDDTPQFTSSSLDKNQWSSMTREYCFVKKELSFGLAYEFSPMAIPIFQVTNSISEIYLTIDSDELYPIRLQKLIDALKDFSQLKMDEKICFEGAYLPADSPQDVTYIMIDEIESKNLKLEKKDFLLEELDLD